MVAGCSNTSVSSNKLPPSQQILVLPINPASIDIKTLDSAEVQDA
jgi:hypothetical protein